MLNRIIITGRLCADPEMRKTGTGISVCSLRIANDRDYSGKNNEKETDFFDVVAWRGTAEFICKYFTKGRLITLDGRLQTRAWTDKEGQKRVSHEIVAENAYFGDSKREEAPGGQDSDQYANVYAYGAPNGPVPGIVSDDFAPDF